MHEVFAQLDEFEDPIPIEFLREWIERISLTHDQVAPYVRFHAEHYMRNLMHSGPAYQALILCWQAGQRSPIHDHLGSSCAVRIIQGTATETVFDRTSEGLVYPTHSNFLTEGSTTASASDDIHQVSNLQSDQRDLVTLHVYSPPLLVMNTFSLFDDAVSRFVDPVNLEFVSGAGI